MEREFELVQTIWGAAIGLTVPLLLIATVIGGFLEGGSLTGVLMIGFLVAVVLVVSKLHKAALDDIRDYYIRLIAAFKRMDSFDRVWIGMIIALPSVLLTLGIAMWAIPGHYSVLETIIKFARISYFMLVIVLTLPGLRRRA